MALIGSPITLAELKSLAEFVRWQDIGARVADLIAAKRLPNGYPLVSSRLPGSVIDLCVGRHWQKVEFAESSKGGLAVSNLRGEVCSPHGRRHVDWVVYHPCR